MATKRLKFHIVFNPVENLVTILQLDRRTTAWYDRNQRGIGKIMNGLSEESPIMTDALLGEIANRIAKLAAETSGLAVEMRYGTGEVHYFQPGILEAVKNLLG